jgi:exonuclease SbcC
MQIQRIKLKNLASLEGEIDLDFQAEPLKSAGIFAITGQTGSGKSTILDAICLALYGTTPRYNSNSEKGPKFQDVSGSSLTLNDARRILRIGATEGYASVEFLGITGDRYCADWSVRRARNKADGNMMAAEISLTNLSRNSKEQGTATVISKRIQEVAGLSFGQFTRVILLSQGEFAAFLKAGSGDRAELLEKLTGTEIYSLISQRVFERHRKEENMLDNLNKQKDAVSLLSAEEKEEKEIQLKSIEEQKKDEMAKQNDLKAHQVWLDKSEDLNKKIEGEDNKLKIATTRLAENAGKEDLLQQVEKFGPVRPHLSEKLRLEGEIEKTKQRATDTAKTLESKKTEREQADAVKKQWEAEVQKAGETQSASEPAIENAIALDTRLGEIRSKREKDEQKLNSLLADLKEKQDQEGQAIKNLDRLRTNQADLEAYFDANSGRKALAENANLVLSKLEDARLNLQKETEAQKLETGSREQFEKAREKLGEAGKAYDETLEGISGLMMEISELRNRLKGLNPDAILKNLKQVEDKVSELSKDISLLERIAILDLNWKEKKESLSQQQNRLIKLNDDLQEILPGLKNAQTDMEESQNALRIARLAAAESVIELRHQLADGEDCPVCGSKEHPYRIAPSDLGTVNDFLEKEAARYQDLFNQLTGSKTALENQIISLENEIPNLKETVLDAEKGINELKGQLSEKTLNLEDLNDRLEQEKARRDSLSASQQSVIDLQNLIDEKTKLYNEINAKSNQLEKEKTRLEGVLKTEANSIKLYKEAVEAARTAYQQIIQELLPFFDKEDWETNWRRNPESFVESLKSFSSVWTKKSDERTNNLEQILRAEGDLKTAENTCRNLEKQHSENQQALDAEKGKEQSLLSERKAVLDGRPVKEVQEELRFALEAAKTGLEDATQNLKQLELSLEGISSDLRNNEENRERFCTDLEKTDQSIQLWLQQNPEFAWEGILSLMAIADEEVVEIRRIMDEIKDQKKNAESVLEAYRLDLSQHQQEQKSSLSASETEALLEDVKEALEELDKQSIQIKSALENHANQEKLAGRLLEEIRKQDEVRGGWARLNQIIGSSDGKKFRQKAQEYTLDVLLAYANVQMQILNKRYKLERIPESLSLQIVDLDMGGEIRPVGTLSGGESFLASLALALGLSSLTSASMRVDSLFIDEGFGSLDPQTLSIAMDALERLNNQGKKVGVISHVQEMTERIPVQIRVYKENNGKSRVEVTH